MGRGLSKQQRDVLAFGVAVNAHRNNGTPRPATLLCDACAVNSGDWKWYHPGMRMALSDAMPEVWRDSALFAVAGLVPDFEPKLVTRRPFTREGWVHDGDGVTLGQIEVQTSPYYDCEMTWKPDPRNRSRQVSLGRAISSLATRGLLAFNNGSGYWQGQELFDPETSPGSPPNYFGLPAHMIEWWEDDTRQHWGYTVTPEAYELVGDSWQVFDADTVAEAVSIPYRRRHIWRENRERVGWEVPASAAVG